MSALRLLRLIARTGRVAEPLDPAAGHDLQVREGFSAAWKYVILGAVGVAIAFLGVALLSAAAQGAHEGSLSWGP